MAKVKRIEDKEEWFNKKYIKCENCGYNNSKSQVNTYGKCIACNHVMDAKVYLKRKLLYKSSNNDNVDRRKMLRIKEEGERKWKNLKK